MTCVGGPLLLLLSVGATRTSIANKEVRYMHAFEARRRTFKVDNVAAADADAHRVLRCAAPQLRDFPPCSELVNRACFVADDETQYGDDAPRIRPTTQRHFVRPIDFKHGE